MNRFDALPPLEQRTYSSSCKICGNSCYLFDILDFNKSCSPVSPFQFGYAGIPVEYYRCPSCELVFTPSFDQWTNAEFSSRIYNADYPKVDPEYDGTRARNNARLFQHLLSECRSKRILDYGSGGGGLCEELTNGGFESVSNYDPFSSPERPQGRFDIIILMEVMEHSPQPVKTLADVQSLLADDGIVLIGQYLQPADIYRIKGSWWYLAPRNGHVSTYSEKTFIQLAEMAGLRYHRGGALYCFAQGQPDAALQGALTHFQPGTNLRLLADRHLLSGAFHGVEQNQFGKYRWSAGSEYRWEVEPDPYRFRLAELPYCMFMSETYASACEVRIGDAPVEMEVVEGLNHGALRFEVPASPHTLEVKVTMPQPITPRQAFGGDDDRPLGLAIMAA